MVSGFSLEPFRDLYPFESRFFEPGGHRMHYLDEGEGEPLLMLHGNPTWSFYYRNLIKGLKSQFRCVVPDHMGCGLSDKPQDYPYTLSQHIDNLESLVEHLKLDRLTLVMHDWGGAIGMGFAVRYPEMIKRLVIFNTAAFIADRIPFSINLCRQSTLGPLAILRFNLFAKLATSWASKVPGRM
ncbi:MAG: alpha/beta fold hydrolase, partial [Nitrospinaceae bacterium]|nr:alpha/beta fold hydrolase [Nitrospinaceae bacterium]NIX37353.1 alpha/beta fold hydrolase [Nitrospinaceae bacterium]